MILVRTMLWGIGCALLSSQEVAAAVSHEGGGNPLYTALQKVEGVEEPVISLNGDWQFRYTPSGKWAAVQVPGELAMQGFAIEHDKPYTYRKSFTLPSDYAGKKTILRFDGVYVQARLSVNGTFVREHFGGFTRWDTDITPWVRPGRKNVIEVEITDRLDDISYASGYAHHPIGGILRNVSVLAQPETCLTDFYVETELDSLYQDAILKIGYQPVAVQGTSLSLALTDPTGKPVSLRRSTFPLHTIDEAGETIDLPISAPTKWDAEHPNLYQLTVAMKRGETEISRFTRLIGFRDIRIVKDRMLVNGKPVKLRGACRHDIHPTLGRTTTPELDSLDVARFKEANMNFVRTSHYPPSEKFLEYCDRMGVYVECETGVCFVETHRQKNYAPGASQDDPSFRERYLSQCQEMVKSFRSNASVLFWSIGNESRYGKNFQLCWDWVKATDRTRPVIFSYPGSVDTKEKIYDLLSMHYQDVNGDLHQWGMTIRNFQGYGLPVIFDEWAHPACYTYKTLQDDPNIRSFWALSLDKMWSRLFPTSGGLGGAIWGYIDETFALPDPKVGTPFWKEFAHTAKPKEYEGKCVGYGEWGIVDVWRRRKPEFWATKKAYSPVKLMTTKLFSFVSGERLLLPIYNRFDHTNLNEIKITYNYKGKEKPIAPPCVAPHQKGLLEIPAEDWKDGERCLVRFRTTDGELIDIEQLTLGKEQIEWPTAQPTDKDLRLEETADRVVIRGEGFEIPFDKQTGLITQASVGGEVVIERGPFLHLDINLNHLTGAEVRRRANNYQTHFSDWKKVDFSYTKHSDCVSIALTGFYKEVELDIHFVIYPNGRIEMNYRTAGEPNGYLRETGLRFELPASVDRLAWKRKGHWSYYPPESFAGNEGDISLYESRQAAYGKQPEQEWQYDTRDYYYWSDAGTNCRKPLTRMAKGMKEHIYYYTLSSSSSVASHTGFSVISTDASVACRLNKSSNEQLSLFINNRWDYPEIAWGNYCKTLEASPCYGQIRIELNALCPR